MKKTIVAGLIAICGYLLGSFPAAAIDKVEQTDDSRRVYQRQAVMVLPQVGLESARVPVRVKMCHGKCRERKGQVFTLSPALRTQLGDQAMQWLYQKRFDVVRLEAGQLKIVTRSASKAIPAPALKALHTPPMSETAWQKAVENYLSRQLAPFILPLQKAALAQRYREQSEQERATFIRTQAKSLGIPMKVVSTLLDSQFVMAMYQPAIRGELTITYVKPQGERSYYDSDMDFDLRNKLYIYRYDSAAAGFKLFKVLEGESGETGASLKTRSFPSNQDLHKLFERALQSAWRASLIQLVHKLKAVPQFNMAQTVQSVDWRTITALLSEQDDLRMDAMYRIQRSINGVLQTVGLAKVRKVAPAPKENEQPVSEWIVIKGEAEIYDRLSEVPWTGAYWGVDLFSQDFTFDSINGATVLKPEQKINWLRWQARFDRGYFENDPELSESWLSMYAAFGVGDGDLKTTLSSQSWDTPIGIKLGMDFINHNTLGRGWSAGYGFGVTGYYLAANSSLENGDEFGYFSLDLMGRLELIYLVSPQHQLGLYVGYPVSLLNQARIGDIEVDATITPGLTVGVGYQHTFSTLGFLHRFFKQ